MTRTLFTSFPLAGVAIAAAVLAVVVAVVARRRVVARANALVAPDLGRRAGLLPLPLNGALALALGALAVLGVGLALARPRWGRTTETLVRRGADVVILLDTSASMRATDVTPSRFVLAQKASLSLLSRLGGDRAALVAMEGEAQVLSPLTLDAAAVALFLDSLEPGIGAKPGTSVAAGLNAAVELFTAGPGSGKHCVVISDGEDLEGGVDAAIEKAKGEGIVVHTVFVGPAGAKGAPVPDVDAAGRVTGYKADSSGAPILSRPDPDLMRGLAAETGGTYSTVSPGKTDLDGVSAAIDRKQRGGDSETLATNLEERFQIPLGVAVGAVALLLLGAPSWGRRARPGVAALVVLGAALASGRSLAQPAGAGTQGAPPPAAPAPAPVATPVPSFLDRVLAKPPFASARREAEKGKRALEAKKPAEAVQRFAREAEIAPKDPTGFYNLGTALSAAGKREEAIASLERARRGGDRSVASDAAFNAGTTHFSAGDYDGAAGAFRESLKLSPGREDAAWNWELCVRRAEEKKKQQEKQKQNQKQQQDPQSGAPTPTPDPKARKDPKQDFEEKAKMSRDKAEQLLSAIDKSDLEEQKRRIAEQKSKRRVARDW